MGQVQRNDCVGSIEGGYMHEIKKKMGPNIDYIYCGGYGMEYEVRG